MTGDRFAEIAYLSGTALIMFLATVLLAALGYWLEAVVGLLLTVFVGGLAALRMRHGRGDRTPKSG